MEKKSSIPLRLFFMPSYQCVSCAPKNFNFVDLCRRNEDSRDLWDTRIWREKDQTRVARSMILKRRTLQWILHNTAKQIFIVSCWTSKLKFSFLYITRFSLWLTKFTCWWPTSLVRNERGILDDGKTNKWAVKKKRTKVKFFFEGTDNPRSNEDKTSLSHRNEILAIKKLVSLTF